MTSPITQANITRAQKNWGEAILAISKAHREQKDYKSLAKNYIEQLYAYPIAPTLFKPTLAAQQPFRLKLEDALSYFIGGKIEEDEGFALKNWKTIDFSNGHYHLRKDTAVSMNTCVLTTTLGDTWKIFSTFGYLKDPKDKLRIFLHHASLPPLNKH